MDKKLYIQTYSVRECATDYESSCDVLNKLASYGYAGIQTAGLKLTPEEHRAACDKAGLKIIGGHIGADNFAEPEKAVKIAKTFGCDTIGLGGMPGIFAGDDFSIPDFYKNVEMISHASDVLYENGIKMTYHHHTNEFAKIGNETIMDYLLKELDPKKNSFVLDTYWVVNAGVSLADCLKKFAGRVDILHLKDMAVKLGHNESHICELGAGNIDFKEVVKIAEGTGVKYLCYEQDNGHVVNPLESAKQSAEYFYSII